jgi:hypothetical protein
MPEVERPPQRTSLPELATVLASERRASAAPHSPAHRSATQVSVGEGQAPTQSQDRGQFGTLVRLRAKARAANTGLPTTPRSTYRIRAGKGAVNDPCINPGSTGQAKLIRLAPPLSFSNERDHFSIWI